MALVNLDLIGSFAISRGYAWELAVYYPGNVINALLWGQIWSAYEPDSALAQFTFGRGVYDAVTNLTRIPVSLNSAVTKSLPPTDGGFYVYEIRFSMSNRNTVPLLAGKVHVLQSIQALL